MDCSFAWKSAMQVQIAMKTLDSVDAMTIVDRLLSCVYRAVTVTAVVRNLIARGKIRITCSPLLDSLPVVGGVHISFLEPPRISYDVSSFGANPLLVPGLESWLRSFVEEQAMDPFTSVFTSRAARSHARTPARPASLAPRASRVRSFSRYPDGVTVDVAKLFGATCDTHQMPVGLLCVTVISARGVPKTDIFGLSDPYAKIWIEKSKKQTTTVRSNTLSPVWGEEFDMLVYDLEHQRLNVQLYDSEAIGGDVLIGEAAVPLKSVDWDTNMSVELTVPIEVVYGKGRKQGRNEVVRGSNGVNGGGAPAFENRAFSSATSVASDLLPRRSSTFDGFDELKGAVKGAFRGTKACTVRLKLDYLAFEAPPADHVDDDGSDTGEDNGEAEPGDRRSPSAAANAAALSARAQRFLNGGFLHVHISRALNLQSSAQLTKKFKLAIRVVRGDEVVLSREHSRNGLSKSNSSVNPVFDISTDLLLDSETANDPEANLEVEILVDHFVKRSSSRGKAVIPICDILEEGRIHSRYKLRKVDQRRAGEVELTLVYTSTV